MAAVAKSLESLMKISNYFILNVLIYMCHCTRTILPISLEFQDLKCRNFRLKEVKLNQNLYDTNSSQSNSLFNPCGVSLLGPVEDMGESDWLPTCSLQPR